MLMFDNTGIRSIGIRIVHHGISLEIRDTFQQLSFETHGSILQMTKPIIKEAIDLPRVNYPVRYRIKIFSIPEIVCTQTNFHSLQHLLDHPRVPTLRDTLIFIIKIIIIESETHRKSFDDKRRKFCCFTPPLLLGIILDQRIINIFTNQRYSLFFQIPWVKDSRFFSLLLYHSHSLPRASHSPHLIESIHIEG